MPQAIHAPVPARDAIDGGEGVLERVSGAVEVSTAAEIELVHKVSLALLKGEAVQLELATSSALRDWQAGQLKERVRRAVDEVIQASSETKGMSKPIVEALYAMARRELACLALQPRQGESREWLADLLQQSSNLALRSWREVEGELRAAIDVAIASSVISGQADSAARASIFGALGGNSLNP